nr:Hypothetical protein CBG12049 [Haemonchus contortus]
MRSPRAPSTVLRVDAMNETNDAYALEVARGAPLTSVNGSKKNFAQLMSSFKHVARNVSSLNNTQRHFKEMRMRLFAARTAIDVHPKLILSTKEKLSKELNPSKESIHFSF